VVEAVGVAVGEEDVAADEAAVVAVEEASRRCTET
jgi:hypothetical protein